MNIKIIAIAVGLVLLGGGGAYVAQQQKESSPAQTADTNTAVEQETGERQEIGAINGSMEELFALGQSVTCTYEHTGEAGVTEGVVYVADHDRRMRGDFTFTPTTEDGTQASGSMIVDDSTVYTWSETPEGTFGMQMSVDEMESGAVDDVDSFEGENFDFTTDISYDCSPWNVDASLFVPPADVDFMDLSEQMRQMQEAFQGSASGVDCSMCESIPDEAAAAECRASLQCE